MDAEQSKYIEQLYLELYDKLKAYARCLMENDALAEEAIQSALEDYYSRYPEKRPADFVSRPAHDPHEIPEEE